MPSYTLNTEIYSVAGSKGPLLKTGDKITLTLDPNSQLGAFIVAVAANAQGGTLQGKSGRAVPTKSHSLLGTVASSDPAGITITPTFGGIRVTVSRYTGAEDCVGEWEGPEDP
jgi:hypothetical protein